MDTAQFTVKPHVCILVIKLFIEDYFVAQTSEVRHVANYFEESSMEI